MGLPSIVHESQITRFRYPETTALQSVWVEMGVAVPMQPAIASRANQGVVELVKRLSRRPRKAPAEVALKPVVPSYVNDAARRLYESYREITRRYSRWNAPENCDSLQ